MANISKLNRHGIEIFVLYTVTAGLEVTTLGTFMTENGARSRALKLKLKVS